MSTKPLKIPSPSELLDDIHEVREITLKDSRVPPKTKYDMLVIFAGIEKYLKLQIPAKPINISDDGHHFECPTCHVRFETEDNVEDFYTCYICGQKFKEEDGTYKDYKNRDGYKNKNGGKRNDVKFSKKRK